jgi:hypothetical protein
MSKSRRKFTAEFKTHVAPAACGMAGCHPFRRLATRTLRYPGIGEAIAQRAQFFIQGPDVSDPGPGLHRRLICSPKIYI